MLFLFCRERYPDCTILIDVGMLIRDHGLGDRSENSQDGVSSLLLRTSACKVHAAAVLRSANENSPALIPKFLC